VSLRIAFDLDGVLADMESELVRQAGRLFGEETTRRLEEEPADVQPDASAAASTDAAQPTIAAGTTAETAFPPLRLNLTLRQQRKLWAHIASIENFWTTLEELEPGMIARLATAATERRWEIMFLTRRPGSVGPTAQVQTQRWLESKGFPLPSVYVVQGSRGRIAAALALDIVVDDRPENCLDVLVDSRARAILVWREEEKRLPAAARRVGIGVVKSVAECLDILMQVDSQSETPRLVDRVMRLLGLKEAANV
jgi:hypothetical protein